MNKYYRKVLSDICLRKISEYHEYHNFLYLNNIRYNHRLGEERSKILKKPPEWKINRLYNPFYVFKNKKGIIKSVLKKIKTDEYNPNEPFTYNVQDGSKERHTTVFQIPDEAVSHYLYKTLLSKNKHRFSSFAYAYRDDRNVHFAVQDISYELKRNSRIFVAEFDFKDFFGSINQNYIIESLKSGYYNVSEKEISLIRKFLPSDEKGIYLGTSVSLFIANAICYRLDKNLEEIGVRFARYADDTIIWSNDYTKICKAYDILSNFSEASGVAINTIKSHGISLLQSKEMPCEFSNHKEYVEFLGYKLSGTSIGIKESKIKKIKKVISYILYKHLIQPLNQTPLRNIIIPNNNQDPAFASAIYEIRRYLYGNLTEDMITKYCNGIYTYFNFKGVMSFYPLVDDEEQLKNLDSWLLTTLWLTIKKRNNLLFQRGHDVSRQFPFYCDISKLIDSCKEYDYMGRRSALKIPSFMRIFKAIRIGVGQVGIEQIMHPGSNYYHYY